MEESYYDNGVGCTQDIVTTCTHWTNLVGKREFIISNKAQKQYITRKFRMHWQLNITELFHAIIINSVLLCVYPQLRNIKPLLQSAGNSIGNSLRHIVVTEKISNLVMSFKMTFHTELRK